MYPAFSLDVVGGDAKIGISYEVRTNKGGFAGIVSHNFKNDRIRVWFNSNATRGSAKKFASIEDALDYIYNRRINKGWYV